MKSRKHVIELVSRMFKVLSLCLLILGMSSCREDDAEVFDCPDLQANVGDACVLNEQEQGVLNANCGCENATTDQVEPQDITVIIDEGQEQVPFEEQDVTVIIDEGQEQVPFEDQDIDIEDE